MEREEILETVRKTVEGSKKDLEDAKTAIELLDAMEIDTKEVKKSYEDAKSMLEKMERAHTLVSRRR